MGTCVDSANVIYAAADGLTANCGTLAVPCSFEVAVALVTPTNNIVKLLPGTYGGITINAPPFTLHGDGATLIGEMDIPNPTTVNIVGLTFNIPTAPTVAIRCTQTAMLIPEVNLDRVSVNVPKDGVVGCTATATRSTFKGLTQGFLLTAHEVSRSHFDGGQLFVNFVQGASEFAENCVFENANPGVLVGAGATATPVRFSTFFNATVGCGNPVDLIDDIMVSTTATPVETGTCEHHYIVSMPAVTAQPGDDHVTTADPKFNDPVHGDYHLTAGSLAIDAADPQASAMIDFDGTSRPQGNGSDIGAFEFKP